MGGLLNSLKSRKEKDHESVTASTSQAVANLGLGNFLGLAWLQGHRALQLILQDSGGGQNPLRYELTACSRHSRPPPISWWDTVGERPCEK